MQSSKVAMYLVTRTAVYLAGRITARTAEMTARLAVARLASGVVERLSASRRANEMIVRPAVAAAARWASGMVARWASEIAARRASGMTGRLVAAAAARRVSGMVERRASGMTARLTVAAAARQARGMAARLAVAAVRWASRMAVRLADRTAGRGTILLAGAVDRTVTCRGERT